MTANDILKWFKEEVSLIQSYSGTPEGTWKRLVQDTLNKINQLAETEKKNNVIKRRKKDN